MASGGRHASKIYADAMNSLEEGHGLWSPEPHATGTPMIGDVGYFTKNGGFHRLFNVAPVNSSGTTGFTPLDRNFTDLRAADFEILDPSPFHQQCRNALLAEKYTSSHVTNDEHGVTGDVAQAALTVEYRCEREQGAILDLRTPADTEWLEDSSKVKAFVLRNYQRFWQPPVESKLGLPEGSIVFVNGHMRTRGDWILTAFSSAGSRLRAKVAGEVPGIGGASIHTTKGAHLEGPVVQRAGLLLTEPASSLTGYDQQTKQDTLFIKYYRVKNLFNISLLPKRIEAGAGPHNIPGDRNPDDNMEGIILETSEDDGDATHGSAAYKDPLGYLLDHILATPEVETAIGCLDDLYLLVQDEWPSDIEVYLRQLKPKIHITEDKVGSISMIDAIQKKRRRTIQRAMAGGGVVRGEGEQEISGSISNGQIVLGEGPYAGASLDWPHMVFKHKDAENGSISNAIISPDGKLLAVAWDDVVISLWVLNDGSPGLQLEEAGHSDTVYTLAFSPDSTRLVSGSLDCTAIVWVVGEGVAEWTLSGHGGAIMTVAYAPDGCLVATGSDDSTVKVWGTSNGLLLHTLEGHDSAITKAAFSPSGTRLAACADAVVALWDPLSGQKVAELTSHATAVHDLAFSPDGARLVTGSEDQSGRVWDANTGTELVILQEHTDAVLSVAFSPDGEEVTSGSHDATVVSCGSFDGSRHHVFDAQRTSPVEAVAYSRDGRFLTSGYADGYIRLWDAKSGSSLAEYRGHEGKIRHVDFTPCGDDIMSFADDGTIRVWNVADTLRLT